MYEVIIFTTKQCNYCVKTKKLFIDNNIEFTEIDVKEHEDNMKLFRELCIGETRVPQIIFKDELLKGGYVGLICGNLDKIINAN